MPNETAKSPFAIYQAYLQQGVLAFQWDPVSQVTVFYPRVGAPGHGGLLEWRESSGLGIVHATTYVTGKDAEPYNVALVEMAEGFRLMTRVEGIAAEEVTIGLAVRMEVAKAEDATLIPIFRPLETAL